MEKGGHLCLKKDRKASKNTYRKEKRDLYNKRILQKRGIYQ